MASGSLALTDTVNSGFNSSNNFLSCKSKILMPEAVAAANQYLDGEKAKAYTSEAAFKVYKVSLVFKSHKMMTPSLPAEAFKDPSGEMTMHDT